MLRWILAVCLNFPVPPGHENALRVRTAPPADDSFAGSPLRQDATGYSDEEDEAASPPPRQAAAQPAKAASVEVSATPSKVADPASAGNAPSSTTRPAAAAASPSAASAYSSVTATALRERLAGGIELLKLSSWGMAQKRIVTIEATEAGERLFWAKPGQTLRRDAESCIKVRAAALLLNCIFVFVRASLFVRLCCCVIVMLRGCVDALACLLLQTRDIKQVAIGLEAPGLMKRGKKAKESLYFSLVSSCARL